MSGVLEGISDGDILLSTDASLRQPVHNALEANQLKPDLHQSVTLDRWLALTVTTELDLPKFENRPK